PTADSPGYVPESDPGEEPEEDDEDPEDDLADYPTDRDDDDDEEEEDEPSRDDANDEDEDEDKEEDEEEEHPTPADSVLPVHRMTTRISIRDEPSISLSPREEVERLLALTTPPPSPLTPLSSPLPQIPSPPLPASPPASLLSSDRRADRPEITLPPQKRLGINLGPRCEVGESSAAAAARPIRGRRANYGFFDCTTTRLGGSGFPGGMGTLHGADYRSQTVTLEMLQADHMRQAEIAALRTFNHTRQEQLVQTLTLMQSLQGQVTTLQGQVTALQGQQGPSGGLAQPKMVPKRRTTRLNPSATPTPVTDAHTTTSVTNAQIQAMINEGVTAALAARDATRNGDDSYNTS
ncbi:hypothetical protein Tco_0583173, partial [Tanacetum coccineum]